MISGCLTDENIWDLAKKITSEEELQNFGKEILKLPNYEVRSVMHSKKYALAAREILELWRKDQPIAEYAYSYLYNALRKNSWEQLAEQLRLWAFSRCLNVKQ